MPRYAYKLVPAPQRATKHKGLKGADLFAATIQEILNTLGQDGWEFQRAETLPEDVRTGLTARSVMDRHLLVFRRPLPENAQTLPASPHRATLTNDPSQHDAEDQPSLANLFLDGRAPSDPRG